MEAELRSRMARIPKPPSSNGRVTVAHATKFGLHSVSVPAHKNRLTFRSSSSQTPLAILHVCIAYVKVALIRVVLPANERHFFLQPVSRLSTLSMMYWKVDLVTHFNKVGTPK